MTLYVIMNDFHVSYTCISWVYENDINGWISTKCHFLHIFSWSSYFMHICTATIFLHVLISKSRLWGLEVSIIDWSAWIFNLQALVCPQRFEDTYLWCLSFNSCNRILVISFKCKRSCPHDIETCLRWLVFRLSIFFVY